MAKPLILVTNDDGINAPGIRTLISVMKDVGEIVVVAPDSPQSGMGHAITINSTLHSSRISPKESEVLEYSCSGTPADCVKLAINELMPRKPDLCVSGVNHGSNSSINVIYSGTMSAAIEAGIEGVPAIGFSLLDYRWNANFNESKDFIKKITENALKNGIPNGVVLNVNIPSVKKSEIQGTKGDSSKKLVNLQNILFKFYPIKKKLKGKDGCKEYKDIFYNSETGKLDLFYDSKAKKDDLLLFLKRYEVNNLISLSLIHI